MKFSTVSLFRPRRTALVLALAAGLLAGAAPAGRADEITRRVQEELRKRNLYFGDVDGRGSTQLAAALHRYQERKGFTSTGEADPDTLYSLNVLRPGELPPARPGPAPDTRAQNSPPDAAITPSIPGPLRTFVWPDVTVLRSDAARPAPPPADAEAAAARAEAALAMTSPTGTPAPPPAATGMLHRPTVEQVRDYLARYLQAGERNDPAAELLFYSDRVAYYDEGSVDHAYIARDVGRYDRRWPERRFTLLDPVELSASPDGDPDKFVVNFRYTFNVKNSRYSVGGKTDNVWTVSGHEPDGWKIVSMKEQRVR